MSRNCGFFMFGLKERLAYRSNVYAYGEPVMIRLLTIGKNSTLCDNVRGPFYSASIITLESRRPAPTSS